MTRRQKEYKTRLSERDVTMLMEIYQLQAIRARDLVSIHFKTERHGLERLQELCGRGYLERTFTVKDTGQRNQSVYNIADKGIEVLFRLGKISQERRARDLKLPSLEMLLRIEVSKVAITLEKAGWKILGSRDAKTQLSLPSMSPMQCLFTTPEGKPYQVYVLNKNSLEQTLVKIISELKDNRHGSIVLYKAEFPTDETPAYQDIVKYITEQNVSALELCLIPLATFVDSEGKYQNFAVNALQYGGDEKAERYLRNNYDGFKYTDNRYGFGNMTVERGDREYLVCNYLWRDRTALGLLAKHFKEDEYRNTGKGAIVLTWNGLANEVQKVIDSYQRRDFILVKSIGLQDILDSQEVPK